MPYGLYATTFLLADRSHAESHLNLRGRWGSKLIIDLFIGGFVAWLSQGAGQRGLSLMTLKAVISLSINQYIF